MPAIYEGPDGVKGTFAPGSDIPSDYRLVGYTGAGGVSISAEGVPNYEQTFPPVTRTTAGGMLGQAALTAIAPESWPIRALLGIVGGALGGGTGATTEGRSFSGGAVEGGTGAALGETVGVLGRGATMLPYVKGLVNERAAQSLSDVLRDVNLAAAGSAATQVPEGYVAGGQTMAKLRQAATGGAMDRAMSAKLQTELDAIKSSSYDPHVELTGDVARAYGQVPQLVREEKIGPPRLGAESVSLEDPLRATVVRGPEALSLEQAQQVRTYLGSKAFSDLGKTMGLDEQAVASLRDKLTAAIEHELQPRDVEFYRRMNQSYAGGKVIQEFLQSPRALQATENRIMLNRNELSRYLDANRKEILGRLGPEGYQQLVDQVLSGAQPGQRDIVTPGPGGPFDAARRALSGFGGTPAIATAPIRMALPGISDRYMGNPNVQRVMATSPSSIGVAPQGGGWLLPVQSLLDYLGIAALTSRRPMQ